MTYRIGIDIGTTSLKAVLFDEARRILGKAEVPYATEHPQDGFSEQDPEGIRKAFDEVLGELLTTFDPSRVESLSFSGAMHSLILLDGEGRALTPSILWSDNRALPQVEEFKAQGEALGLYERTGTPVHPMSPFFKLRWFWANTDLQGKTAMAADIKGYLLYPLLMMWVMDYSVASATGLFNLHTLAWDPWAMEKAGITGDKLPLAVEGSRGLPVTNRAFLQRWGFPEHLLLYPGASDGALANLGSGALGAGEATITVGTSGAVRMTVDQPFLDPLGRTFCYYLSPGRYVVGGAVNNGGNLLPWLADLLGLSREELFSRIPPCLNKVLPGAGGLVFLPWLHGERAPYWDGGLSASFVGLRPQHGPEDLLRAALEGVLFNLRQVLELLQEVAGPATRITLTGGFLENPQMAQLLADVLGRELEVADAKESSCLGAILLEEKAGSSKALDLKPKILRPSRNREVFDGLYEEYSRLARFFLSWQQEKNREKK